MIMKYSDPMTFGPSMCLKETKQIYSVELLKNTRKRNECMLFKEKIQIYKYSFHSNKPICHLTSLLSQNNVTFPPSSNLSC